MLKKTFPFFFCALIFGAVFLHLHQKVQIYVEAYKLSKNYQLCNNLADKRDYLTYRFNKKVSIAKLNEWAQNNDFSFVEKEKVLALNLRREEPVASKNRLALALNRLMGISTASATAMTQERK